MKVYRYINFSDSFMNFAAPVEAGNAGLTIGNGIKSGIDATKRFGQNVYDNTIGAAKDFGSGVMMGMGEYGDKMKQGLSNAASATGNFFKGMGQKISDAAGKAWDKTKDIAGQVPDAMSQMGHEIQGRMSNTAKDFGSAYGNMKEGMAQNQYDMQMGKEAMNAGKAQMEQYPEGYDAHHAGEVAYGHGQDRYNAGVKGFMGNLASGVGNMGKSLRNMFRPGDAPSAADPIYQNINQG